MRCVFGLDGGGTSSRLRIAGLVNEPLWEGVGEGVNPNATAPEILAHRLEELFSRGMRELGLSARDFAAGCLGVAGADRAEERAQLDGIVRGRLRITCPLVIVSDPDIALVGGLGNPEGIILIAGTGSIALARLADGSRVRAGGYGHFLSDEGSAFFLGFQAIRRVMRSVEGRDEETTMLPALLERFGLSDPSGFVGLVYRRFDKAAIAKASDIVLAAARTGDALALSIESEAAAELAILASSVYRRVQGKIAHRALLFWGGLFEHAPELKAATAAGIARVHPELVATEPIGSAAAGACSLAIDLLK